jgi:hypothetical protein
MSSDREILRVVGLVCLLVAQGCREQPPASPSASGGAKTAANAPPSGARRPRERPAGTMPAFRTIARQAGLDFERNDDIHGARRILEANGGGVAMFDFDGDGLLDLYFTNGCRLPLKLGSRSTPGVLFRNRGQMQFERATDASRLLQYGFSTGCAVGDYDADGFDDLFVAAFGPTALWRNNGDGTFADATAGAGIAARAWSTSAAFADLDADGHLDLYVVNYLAESDEAPLRCPNPASPDGYEQCSPAKFDGVDDVLFLSDGQGALIDATKEAGLSGTRGKGLGVVISDLDLDGIPEIVVANDGEANFLLTRVPGSAPAGSGPGAVRYRDCALESGVALCESGFAQANMGIAAGDYDASGTVDLFITTFYGDTNTLYGNRGGLVFHDATRDSKLAATTRHKLGFGTVFFDYDNDGWLDLLAANGHVDDRTWMAHGEPYRMQPQIFRNAGDKTFVDVSEWSGDYFANFWLGRGLAAGDLDRDGRIDAAVSHQLAPSVALRNETATENQSLVLRLVGVASNRNGYGARVEIVDAEPPTVRELSGGGSFQAASAPEVHVGIGRKRTANVQIQWPSGAFEVHSDLRSGRWVLIEGRGKFRLDR